MMTGTAPPSTDQAAPATSEACSEHRNTITAAISSGRGEAPDGQAGRRRVQHLAACAPLGRHGLVDQSARLEPQLAGDRARGHGVDEHAAPGMGVGVGARQRQLRRLGHRVGDVALPRPLARGRGHVDDPAPAAPRHLRDRGPHEPHRRHHVDLPHRLPLLVGERRDRPHLAHAGAVDEHVDGLEPLPARRHRALAGVRLGHVERQPGDEPRLALTLLGGRAQRRLTASHQQDAGALGDEAARHLKADPARAAGDDAGAICEAEVHRGEDSFSRGRDESGAEIVLVSRAVRG